MKEVRSRGTTCLRDFILPLSNEVKGVKMQGLEVPEFFYIKGIMVVLYFFTFCLSSILRHKKYMVIEYLICILKKPIDFIVCLIINYS